MCRKTRRQISESLLNTLNQSEEQCNERFILCINIHRLRRRDPANINWGKKLSAYKVPAWACVFPRDLESGTAKNEKKCEFSRESGLSWVHWKKTLFVLVQRTLSKYRRYNNSKSLSLSHPTIIFKYYQRKLFIVCDSNHIHFLTSLDKKLLYKIKYGFLEVI